MEEGLTLLIVVGKRRGDLKGIKVSINLYVTYILFFYDILRFNDGSISDIQHITVALDMFLVVIRMSINPQKSSLSFEGLPGTEITKVTSALPFEAKLINDRIKYLGFHLKPKSYRKQDW